MMVRLTQFSSGAGCGCKLAPSTLHDALADLAPMHPDLLVGPEHGDDAAVWRHGAGALVLTTDFLTPIVDDARAWGRIAATNAVSDVYAMGGRPLLALNIVAWNSRELGTELLREVLAGGADAAEAGGFVVAGGHSIEDPEPKYGMAVLGTVDPDRMLTNRGFRPGDRLILSKPIGVGLVTTAAKRGAASPTQLASAIDAMSTLNADACTAALDAGATGATDVTGFGLLGHLGQAMQASRASAVIHPGDIPVLDGALDLVRDGHSPGGTARNLAWCGRWVDGGDDATRSLLADPQTSGGLLFGASPAAADHALAALDRAGHRAAVIGHVEPGDGRVRVVGPLARAVPRMR